MLSESQGAERLQVDPTVEDLSATNPNPRNPAANHNGRGDVEHSNGSDHELFRSIGSDRSGVTSSELPLQSRAGQ